MSALHFEEFLYRGRPEGDPREPAWHVVLLENLGTSTVSKQAHYERHTLNMAQAEAAGYPLPKLIADINAEALKEIERLRGEIGKLEAKISALEGIG